MRKKVRWFIEAVKNMLSLKLEKLRLKHILRTYTTASCTYFLNANKIAENHVGCVTSCAPSDFVYLLSVTTSLGALTWKKT